jgi:hypothetical protein
MSVSVVLFYLHDWLSVPYKTLYYCAKNMQGFRKAMRAVHKYGQKNDYKEFHHANVHRGELQKH